MPLANGRWSAQNMADSEFLRLDCSEREILRPTAIGLSTFSFRVSIQIKSAVEPKDPSMRSLFATSVKLQSAVIPFLVLLLLVAAPAKAGPAIFEGSGTDTDEGKTYNLNARVIFEVSGDDLIVTLTNIAEDDVLTPRNVLTAVFFDLSLTLTPVSAILSAGSVVVFDDPPPGGNVGGEWAYESGLSGAPGGATKGISSTGLDLFGMPNFNGPNLSDPAAVDGLNYGITAFGDDTSTGNQKVTGSVPLIKYSVVFRLSGATGFDPMAPDAITNVVFQYGTDLNEPSIKGKIVPEPASIVLLCLGSLGLIGTRGLRRRKKRVSA